VADAAASRVAKAGAGIVRLDDAGASFSFDHCRPLRRALFDELYDADKETPRSSSGRTAAAGRQCARKSADRAAREGQDEALLLRSSSPRPVCSARTSRRVPTGDPWSGMKLWRERWWGETLRGVPATLAAVQTPSSDAARDHGRLNDAWSDLIIALRSTAEHLLPRRARRPRRPRTMSFRRWVRNQLLTSWPYATQIYVPQTLRGRQDGVRQIATLAVPDDHNAADVLRRQRTPAAFRPREAIIDFCRGALDQARRLW
jgi:hypothetical protein